MRRIITVLFTDGSGWLFTRDADDDFWYGQDIRHNVPHGTPGIVPNDARERTIMAALGIGVDVTITTRYE